MTGAAIVPAREQSGWEEWSRFVIPASACQPELFLEALPGFPKFFWSSPKTGNCLCASGESRSGSIEELAAFVALHPAHPPVLVGKQFSKPSSGDGLWEAFSEEFAFVPEMYLRFSKAGIECTILTNGARAEELREAVERRSTEAGDAQFPEAVNECRAVARWDRPGFSEWARAVQAACVEFASGRLEKVVLARESRFELEKGLPVWPFFSKLRRHSPECFHFAFQPEGGAGTFFGASPEMLYRRSGRRLESEAVAGTRKRSLDPSEDERLENQLLSLEKERHEHRVVVEELQLRLSGICTAVFAANAPEILKLSKVQHLRTPFAGLLKEGVTDEKILKILHPTPATCGRPLRESGEFLAASEPFDRGLYAGPLGVLDGDFAEFTVAIRSLLLRDRMLHLFAGAGIVDGSDAEKEWEELESKITVPLRLLSS